MTSKRLIAFTAALLGAVVLSAAPRESSGNLAATNVPCNWASGEFASSEPTGTDLDIFTYIPRPLGARDAAPTATFKAIFDADVPPDVRAVFQTAAEIWGAVLESPVPIEVEVKWTDLVVGAKPGEPSRAIMLGNARPTAFRRDFPGAPLGNVWYANALANRLAKKDLDPDKTDIIATFNRKAPWYFGTDGATPRGKYDLLTIMLHELGHGLGFATSVHIQRKEAGWGIKDKEGTRTSLTVFDTHLKNQAGKFLVDAKGDFTPTEAAFGELTSRKLYFSGRLAAAANGGAFPALHAPPVYKNGSSVVHLSESTYPPGTINSLLTPSTFRAEAIHHPGPVAIGILRDMGWGHIEGAAASE